VVELDGLRGGAEVVGHGTVEGEFAGGENPKVAGGAGGRADVEAEEKEFGGEKGLGGDVERGVAVGGGENVGSGGGVEGNGEKEGGRGGEEKVAVHGVSFPWERGATRKVESGAIWTMRTGRLAGSQALSGVRAG